MVLAAAGMAHHNEISERLLMDAPNVRKFSTLFVLDAIRTGASIPTRSLRP